MTEYVVVRGFSDKNDNGRKYAVGDRYPYRGFASKARIEELSTTNNLRGKVMIALKEEPIDVSKIIVEEKPLTKKEINSMNVATLKAVATEKGIEDAENMSGGQLKKALIEKLEL